MLTFGMVMGGARDFLLIFSQNIAYITQQFGSGGLVYFDDYPVVLRLIWAVHIVAGLSAPVLLMAGNRWAFETAVIAAAAQVSLLIVTFMFLGRWTALGTAIAWFDIGVGVISSLFAYYCLKMARPQVEPI